MRKYAILFVLFAFAACADDDAQSNDKPKEEKSAKPAKVESLTETLICPQVAILREGQVKDDFGGEAPDKSQLVASARMVRVDGDCAYRKDGIDILYTLSMTAKRGPRLGGKQVSFPYFVAVIDPADNIVSKQIVTATFRFSGGDTTATDDEELHVFIPLSGDALQSGPNYRVLASFQRQRGEH